MSGFWADGFWSSDFWSPGFWIDGAVVQPVLGGGISQRYPIAPKARNEDEELLLILSLAMNMIAIN